MKKNTMIVAGVVAGIMLVLMFFPLFVNGTSGVVRGVKLQDRDVSGWQAEGLQRYLAEQNNKYENAALNLTYQTYTWSIPMRDLKLAINAEKTAAAVSSYGRTGSWFRQWWEQWQSYLKPVQMNCTVAYDVAHLNEILRAKVDELAAPPRNASVSFNEAGDVVIETEKPRLILDYVQVAKAAEKKINAQDFSPLILQPSQVDLPTLRKAQLASINAILGEYTTYYGGDENRSANIYKGSAAISGALLAPGETFSFNDTTGLRTYEAGYLSAPVFINGELVPDAGGGICQDSTTMFNAVLLAGLDVVQRTPHFAPVGYTEIGRDATVADNSIDFIWVNSAKSPVYVMATAGGGAINVKILGNSDDRPSGVAITTEPAKVLPHEKKEIVVNDQKEDVIEEEGHDGYSVVVHRRVSWSDGRALTDTFYSVYDPVTTITKLSPQEAQKRVASLAKATMEHKPGKGREASEAKNRIQT